MVFVILTMALQVTSLCLAIALFAMRTPNGDITPTMKHMNDALTIISGLVIVFQVIRLVLDGVGDDPSHDVPVK